jgi:hypothetical protein
MLCNIGYGLAEDIEVLLVTRDDDRMIQVINLKNGFLLYPLTLDGIGQVDQKPGPRRTLEKATHTEVSDQENAVIEVSLWVIEGPSKHHCPIYYVNQRVHCLVL